MDERLVSYLNGDIKSAVSRIGGDFNEIRLRREKPVVIMRGNKAFFLGKDGGLYSLYNGSCISASSICFDKTFEAVCRYSVHSYQENIRSGFITLEGGHRVGLCGTAVVRDGVILNVKNISGMNFRAAREMKGCSDEIFNRVFSAGLSNVLIAGAPARGKTTVLRDLCRKLGSVCRVSVIDERSEIAAVYEGVPQNDIGANTDVLDGYSKSWGIETAVRVMSPDIIICDEAGGKGDIKAFEYAASCGVKICAAVHGEAMTDIKKKIPFYKEFDYIVFLSSKGKEGTVSKIIGKCEYD